VSNLFSTGNSCFSGNTGFPSVHDSGKRDSLQKCRRLVGPIFAERWGCGLLIWFVTFLVWGHTLSFDFAWDDKQFVVENSSILSLTNIPRMFYSLEAQSSFPEGFVLFRPLRTAVYALLFFSEAN